MTLAWLAVRCDSSPCGKEIIWFGDSVKVEITCFSLEFLMPEKSPYIFKNLLNLLGWHWLMTFCWFQVYDSIIHHLYIVLCVHCPKSSLLPSPFIPTLASFISPQPPSPLETLYYCLCLWGFSFFLYFFVLNHITFFTQPLNPFPLLTVVSLFSMSLFLFC